MLMFKIPKPINEHVSLQRWRWILLLQWETCVVIKMLNMFMNNHQFTPSVCLHIIYDNTEAG